MEEEEEEEMNASHLLHCSSGVRTLIVPVTIRQTLDTIVAKELKESINGICSFFKLYLVRQIRQH